MRRSVRSTIALTLVVALAACGQTSETTVNGQAVGDEPAADQPATNEIDGSDSGSSQPDQQQPTSAPRTTGVAQSGDVRISETDLPAARSALIDAKNRWNQAGLDDYTLTFQNSSQTIEVQVQNGAAIDNADLTEAQSLDLGTTVDDLFQRIDSILTVVEVDGSKVGTDEGGCEGIYFDVVFEATTGVPRLYDRLTPCDDGDPFWITVVPAS